MEHPKGTQFHGVKKSDISKSIEVFLKSNIGRLTSGRGGRRSGIDGRK